jgi:serine protease
MFKRPSRSVCATLAIALAGLLAGGLPAASAKPILMPTLQRERQQQQQIWRQHVLAPQGSLQPPAPPCPENGELPSPLSNCGLPEFPATTLPFPGNMAYWGGHVQVNPHVYVVYWGWGEKGAFPAGQACRSETITEGATTATLRCDPDGAGRYMANWVHQLGGTQWAGTQSQYYQTVKDPAGNPYDQHIANPTEQLAGIWVDDADSITGLPKTLASNPPGATNTYTDLAAEAARAAAHFHVTDLPDADFVIAQPANYSDPNAVASGYCAFHDYTYPGFEGGIYNHVTKGIAYTNMPYALSINSSGTNVCGENAVNAGPGGKLDGFSIVLGHEIEETVTDPGAEDILGSGTSTTNLGGWYDSIDANENGDKCAWVGESLGAPGEPTVTPIPGALNDIKGNRGGRFAVQSLWSNQAAEGAGYCAGAGNDLPQPLPPL